MKNTSNVSSEDLQRRAIELLFGITILAVPIWSLIYWQYDLKLAAAIPILYSTVASVNIILYWIRGKKHFKVFLVCCFTLYFILPPTLQWVLGGYRNGSAVIIWMFPVIVAAFIYQGTKSAILWGTLFMVVMVISVFSPAIVGNPSGQSLPDHIIDIFFVLNISVVGIIVAGVIYYLVGTISKRSKDLSGALKDITQLKELQDSDYFLISYLSNPLSGVRIKSENIQIEYLIEQKKRFTYKNKHHEIGGDICIAEEIMLRGRKYCAFLNGDAMGKSLQGAAGAIIMGSLFRAAVNRNHNHRSNLLPELWLQNCYSDFQQLFESFDGSMFMSIAFGLLDEECGMLYYFNAEHPLSALYRDGVAQFIDSGKEMRKLGVPEIAGLHEPEINLPAPEGLFRLNTFLLKDSDVIFLGSDGRDDLIIGKLHDGQNNMNTDESLFLRGIETANGDLIGIRNFLEKQGKFTDDLSLMSVKYRSNSGIANDRIKRKSQIDDSLTHLAETANSRDFVACASLADEYIRSFPESTALYRVASIFHRKSGNLQIAADYGEAYRIRKGGDLRNLLHLSKIYLKLGNHFRASALINRAGALSPGDSRVERLMSQLL